MEYSKRIIEEIQKSIDVCEKHTSVEGSEELYNRLIAKFTSIDKDFKIGLPNNGQFSTNSSEFDYRPEIQAIRDKLKMMLIKSESTLSDVVQHVHDKLEELIASGETAYTSGYSEDISGFMSDEINGSLYNVWVLELEVFIERYLKAHPLYKKITSLNLNNKGIPCAVRCILDCLRVISKDTEFFSDLEKSCGTEKQPQKPDDLKVSPKKTSNSKIFLVHGHDEAMKQSVARILEKAGLEIIILHEKPDAGNTIIEKFVQHTDVAYAIVLYSPCDVGRSREAKPEAEKPRVRQNVLFEHGYLIGRLGRDRVTALVKSDIELPSDLGGVLYTPMDEHGAWKNKLAKELEEANIQFDLKKMIY